MLPDLVDAWLDPLDPVAGLALFVGKQADDLVDAIPSWSTDLADAAHELARSELMVGHAIASRTLKRAHPIT